MVRRNSKRSSGRLVAYIRVSTDEQALGLDAQRSAIESWAGRQGLQVASWHADDGVSGGNDLAERPALVEAISALRKGDTLVVAKRDRLARDTFVAAQVGRLVAKAGARVVSADGAGNGDTAADELMRHMLDGFAQFERQLIAARTKAALAAKSALGERVGKVPYGYRLGGDGVHLVEEPAEQAVIARARELNAPNMSCQAIADQLADEGLLNRAGKPFARQAIHLLLSK